MRQSIFFIFTLFNFINAWRFFVSPKPRIPIKINKFKNKKFISSTPGGISGFYSLGICSYIQEKYDLSNYSFLGASAGAWNSMLLCNNKHTIKTMLDNLLLDHENIFNATSVSKLQQNIKRHLLKYYTTTDFDFSNLYITISQVHNFNLIPLIITNITSLELAVECCIVSSHIPYVTNDKLIEKFNNTIIGFDGGFTHFPSDDIYTHLIISPTMFNDDIYNVFLKNLIQYKLDEDDINYLFNKGIEDAENHAELIEYIMNPKNNYLNIKDNNIDIIPFPPFSPL